MREFRLFAVAGLWRDENRDFDSFRDDEGYRGVRGVLADQIKRDAPAPKIPVAP